MIKKLLVLSVYSGNSDRWFQLQQEFLYQTTHEFEHILFLNNVDVARFGTATILDNRITNQSDIEQHCYGLNQLLAYAKTREHRGILILDSDCFPICQWESKLRVKLESRSSAAIVRVENLDTFYHPSAVFSTNADLKFSIRPCKNLLGDTFDEVVCDTFDAFPLLRTNKRNVHPVMCGIYYDLFYHHSCGSRPFSQRSTNNQYYQYPYDHRKYLNELFKNPAKFISYLQLTDNEQIFL